MSQVIRLKHLKKLVTTSDEVDCHLVWARKVFPDKNIYEISLERLDGGYTMWFVELVGSKFKFISCSLCASVETLAIKLTEKETSLK